MKISKNGLKQIKLREGEILKGYLDSKGLLTIGVGHLVKKGEPYKLGVRITQEESDRLLDIDLDDAEDAVNAVGVPMSQNQFDALVSFVINIGIGGFNKSTVRKRLRAKDYIGAGNGLMAWVKPPEITGRRKKEKIQFFTPDAAFNHAPARLADTTGAQIDLSINTNNDEQPIDIVKEHIAEGESVTAEPIEEEQQSGAAEEASPEDKAKSPQLVTKETPSTFIKWMVAVKLFFAGLLASVTTYCGGDEVKSLVTQKAAEGVTGDNLPLIITVIACMVLILGLCAAVAFVAAYVYDKSANRANALNQQKVEKAANTLENTVEYKKE